MAKLLVVEDEVALGDFLRSFFQKKGFSVKVVTRGDAVIPAIEADPPHLMLLDMRIPGLSGIEVLRAMRQKGLTTKVIAVTAVDNDAIQTQAKEQGVVDYVTKPFSLDSLEKLVMSHLAGMVG